MAMIVRFTFMRMLQLLWLMGGIFLVPGSSRTVRFVAIRASSRKAVQCILRCVAHGVFNSLLGRSRRKSPEA